MTETERAALSFSGGKDSVLALHYVLKESRYKVDYLFVSISRLYQRVSMHGIRKELITRQGMALGIRTRKMYLPENISMEMYQKIMEAEMQLMKERGIHTMIFGDIFLEDLKQYREEQLNSIGMKAVFPLWKMDTVELYKTFVTLGYKAKIVSVNLKKLGKEFLGKELSLELLKEFPKGIDVCGENGEFHTFVYDGEIFQHPVSFKSGEIMERNYVHNGEEHPYAFLDLKVV